MKVETLVRGASVLLLTAAALATQESLDKYPPALNTDGAFVVNLEHAVVAGRAILPPGTYTVRPIYLAGAELPVLRIRGENGLVDIAVAVAPGSASSPRPKAK